jgi:hypothetical protein
MKQIETAAKEVASELGRDWADCGSYERQSYMDEVQRRLDCLGESANPNIVRLLNGTWANGPLRETD